MGINNSEVLDTTCPVGVTSKEHYTNLYKQIGKHIANNAESLAGDVTDLTGDIKIEIVLNVNEIITLQKTSNKIMIGE